MVERRKASAPCKARAASQDAEVMDQRFSAFRFLYLFCLYPGWNEVKSGSGEEAEPLSPTCFFGLQSMIVTAAGPTSGAF